MLSLALLIFYRDFIDPLCLVFDSNHCLELSFLHMIHTPFAQLSKNGYVGLASATMQIIRTKTIQLLCQCFA